MILDEQVRMVEHVSSCIEKNLMPGEVIVHEAKLHWIVMVPLVLLGLLFVVGGFALLAAHISGVFFLVIGATILWLAWLKRRSFEFVVTNRRLICKRGIVRRHTDELFLAKIESMHVRQGLLGRVFDFGSVTVRGTGTSWEPFSSIAAPLEMKRSVQGEVHSAANPEPM
jgi:uncharacterized membrane protein YdbT with pleckstrin-like domain